MVGCDPPLDGDEPLDCHGEGGVDGGRHRHLGQGQQRGRAGGQDLNTAWSSKYYHDKRLSIVFCELSLAQSSSIL